MPPPTETQPRSSASGTALTDADRLKSLADRRAAAKLENTYKIGPGDLLSITTFDLPEMTRKVRVDAQGSIQLPLIGSLTVARLSEAEASQAISSRLSAFVHGPQVDVFVEEYKSQQVAVTGAVAKPGLYPLTRDRRSILDLLSEAGGLSQQAGGVVEFIPAESGGAAAAAAAVKPAAMTSMQGDARGILIEVNALMRAGTGSELSFPVVPGDVIFVPVAGGFTVEGWIDKPGTYPLTRNTTVLAALSAAGGPLFPARMNRVEILRSGSGANASREVVIVDLSAIRSGEQPDAELRSGDIVRVPGYWFLIAPYSVYTFVKTLMFFGAQLPIA